MSPGKVVALLVFVAAFVMGVAGRMDWITAGMFMGLAVAVLWP